MLDERADREAARARRGCAKEEALHITLWHCSGVHERPLCAARVGRHPEARRHLDGHLPAAHLALRRVALAHSVHEQANVLGRLEACVDRAALRLAYNLLACDGENERHDRTGRVARRAVFRRQLVHRGAHGRRRLCHAIRAAKGAVGRIRDGAEADCVARLRERSAVIRVAGSSAAGEGDGSRRKEQNQLADFHPRLAGYPPSTRLPWPQQGPLTR